MLNSPWFLFYFFFQARKLISDFAIILSILIFCVIDALVGVDTPKLIVPSEFKVGELLVLVIPGTLWLSFPCHSLSYVFELVLYDYLFLYFRSGLLLGTYIHFVYFFTKIKCLISIKCKVHIILICIEIYKLCFIFLEYLR